MIIAGALTLGVCIIAGNYFNQMLLPKYVFEGTKILTITMFCFVVYFVLNLILKMSYVEELVKRLKH